MIRGARERYRRLRLGTVAVLVLFAASCAKAPPVAQPQPARVTVAHPVTREIVDYNDYNGWTDASKTVEIRSRVRGHIQKVAFTDGQLVQAGELLFQLDPRPFQADIDTAQGQVEVDKAQLEFAQAEEAREQELFDKKVSTKSAIQKAIASRKSWEAKAAAAQEEVRRRELDLEYATITAPISGKISRAQLVAGNLVNAGGTDPVLSTIVSLDPIYVYFYVDERSLLEYRQRSGARAARTHEKPLKESQIPFDFALETDEGFPHHGFLDFADNKINAETGTIEVRGATENADARYLPGSRVRVRIPISEPYEALLIPDTAILSDQDQRYLLCLNAENVVVRRNVKLGRLLDDGMRVIQSTTSEREGLSSSDWVVVNGLQRARINYAVEPMDADGEPIVRN